MAIDSSIIARLDNAPVFDSSKIVNLINQGQQRRMQQENHAQQMQLDDQRLAAGERTARAAELQLGEDAISRSALQESGGDMDKYVDLVRQRAKSPATIQAAQTHQQAIVKGALANQKEQGGITDAKNERMAGLLDQVSKLKKENPEAYAQSFPQIHADIQSIDPEAAGHLDPNDPESLHLDAFGTHYASLKWGKQAAEAVQAEAKRREDAAAAQRQADAFPVQQQKALADAQLAADTAAGRAPIQPADQARMDEQRASGEAQRALTKRGQDMNDSRARELAQIARDGAAAVRENKPPTSAQATVATYAERLHQANPILESAQQDFGERTWNSIAPNWAKTEKGQQFQQAEKNYINSVLRRESGAAIAESEFKNARGQYIPQPGDSPAVLAQKRNNRLLVQESFRKAAGKAYEDPDELIRSAGGSPSPGKTQAFKSGGITYNIPDSEVAEFLGTHPDAQKAKAK